MPIRKRVMRSCCGGGKSFIYDLPRSVKKDDLDAFLQQGYKSPPHFVKNGTFYVEKNGFVATCHFGSKTMRIRCSAPNCAQTMSGFDNLLNQILTVPK